MQDKSLGRHAAVAITNEITPSSKKILKHLHAGPHILRAYVPAYETCSAQHFTASDTHRG
jgi:hypothetical protein